MTDFRQRNRRLLDAALKAADQGWFVFPLRPGHKTPALRHDWERRATRDRAALHRWFAATPFNIGIATGPSNLIVVDLDPPPPGPVGAPEASHGRQSLVRLAWQYRQVVPADTFTVLTPRGGQHLYFTAPDDVALPNTAGRLGAHVDTRGRGGYVVGPGSAIAGRLYRVTCALPPSPTRA